MTCEWVRVLQHSATASPAAQSSTETRTKSMNKLTHYKLNTSLLTIIKCHYSRKELSDHSVLKVLVHSIVTICFTKLHIWINLSLNSISYQQNHLPNLKSPADNVHASVWKREVCLQVQGASKQIGRCFCEHSLNKKAQKSQ